MQSGYSYTGVQDYQTQYGVTPSAPTIFTNQPTTTINQPGYNGGPTAALDHDLGITGRNYYGPPPPTPGAPPIILPPVRVGPGAGGPMRPLPVAGYHDGTNTMVDASQLNTNGLRGLDYIASCTKFYVQQKAEPRTYYELPSQFAIFNSNQQLVFTAHEVSPPSAVEYVMSTRVSV